MPAKSKLTETDQHHDLLLKKAARRSFGVSMIVQSLVMAYFIAAFVEISNRVLETSIVLSWPLLVAASIVLGFLGARSKFSLGTVFAEYSDPLLKCQRRELDKSWNQSFWGWMNIVILATTFVLGWLITEMSFVSLLSESGLEGARNLFTNLFSPRLDMPFVKEVLGHMVETVFIAFMATALALPASFLLSFLMARNLMKGSARSLAVYNGLRMVFNISRSVEPLIWAIIFSVWVGIGPFAGMLALMIHSVSSLVKLYSEQIESIDKGPIEAITATGANRIQVIWVAVVPQIVLPYISFTIYRWDINVRMATIIGLVGGGGVGTLLNQYQGLAKWHEVGTIIIVIALVVWLMDYLSAKLREAIR